MPFGTAPPWNEGLMEMYKIGLRNIPNDAVSILCEAVIDRCKFRPTVHEIVDLWRDISNPVDPSAAHNLVAEILALRDKYGEYVVPDPHFPMIRDAGEPTWTDPLKRQIVATFGGWVAFCRDDSPSGVLRGQLLKVAAAVLVGQGDETINRLRLEYRQVRAALPAVAPDTEIDVPTLRGSGTDDLESGSTVLRLNEVIAKAKEHANS